MTRSVLTGSRVAMHAKSSIAWSLRVWWPVILVLLVVCRESTDSFSAERTAGWIRHSAEYLFGPIANADWALINHHVRKTGHFLWYGLTGLAWLRAWLLTWLAPMRLMTAAAWRAYAVTMAAFSTVATASHADLNHSYSPRRTGLVSDIWLDTSGATVMILCVALTWLQRPVQPLAAPAWD